jgi:hypothetical protein
MAGLTYTVQSSVPVAVFANSLKTQTKIRVTSDNVVFLSLLATEFSLTDLSAQCGTFSVSVAEFTTLFGRVSKLERQLASFSKPLRQLEDEIVSQDGAFEGLRSAFDQLKSTFGNEFNQLKRAIGQLRSTAVSARPKPLAPSPTPQPSMTPSDASRLSTTPSAASQPQPVPSATWFGEPTGWRLTWFLQTYL